MKKLLTTLVIVALSFSVNAESLIINVPSIVGKTKAEVSVIIGKPTFCGASKYGEKCKFEKGDTEIVFINGKADWITIEGLDGRPFADPTIKLLGFKFKQSSFSNSFTKRWDSLQGVRSISLFKGASGADYAYIKAYTK